MEILLRAEAKEKGLFYFFEGQECPNGHVAKRLVRNNACQLCLYVGVGRNRRGRLERKDVPYKRNMFLGKTKDRARKRGVPYELTQENVVWNTHCPVLGVELDYFSSSTHQYNLASIDRKIPELGYVPSNCVIISFRANMIKSASNLWELEQIRDYVANPSKYLTTTDRTDDPKRIYKKKRIMIGHAKTRSKRDGLTANLTIGDFTIPTHCPILGIPLSITNTSLKFDSPTLDKIDPSKGYNKGNLQVISMKANLSKCDATLEELDKVIEYVRNHCTPSHTAYP